MPTNNKPHTPLKTLIARINAIRTACRELTNLGYVVEAIAIDCERGGCIWIAEPDRNDCYEWFHNLSTRQDQTTLYMDGLYGDIRVCWKVGADDFDNDYYYDCDNDINWEELS